MIRLIARIDSRNSNHIKTVQCEGTRVIRSVSDSLSLFSEGKLEHDEIIVLDNVASLYGVDNWLVRSQSSHIYVPLPLAIGGGINTVSKALQTQEKGADMIVLNTAAFADPSIIHSITSICGQQAFIMQIDVRKVDNTYMCFTHGGREPSGYSLKDWIYICNNSGVGQLFITSIDTEGCSLSYPIELAELITSCTKLPVIVSGGIRSSSLMVKLYADFGISAFAFSSLVNTDNTCLLQLRESLHLSGLPVRMLR